MSADPREAPAGPPDTTGLLVIRAWVEDGSAEPLRAHLRITTDVAAGFEQELTLSAPDDVCAEVRAWLAHIVDGVRPQGSWDGDEQH